jgi:FKBP-type peptidyl-prolyl cis-trans isomerase
VAWCGLLATLTSAPACERAPIEVAEPPIRIERETLGSGSLVRDGEIACIAYTIDFLDGRRLMSDDETCMTVGGNNVIDGLRRTLEGMREGGERTVLLPPHTHWGRAGHGPVPPGTTLRLKVRVLAVEPAGWRPES